MILLKAERIKIKLGNLWKTPVLRVLLTGEDVVVARCLDFTVSSHGENEDDALKSLGYAVKEYILSVENNALDAVFDSAYDKYWKIYYELESKQNIQNMKDSLKTEFRFICCYN